MPLKSISLAFATAFVALAGSSAQAGGFTAEQAAAGETAYNANCAQCHGRQLEGTEAPALVGPDVMQNWDTAAGLFDFIRVAMPPSAPGQLGDETYLNIVAYIMKFNGAEPGDKPLTNDPALLASISLPAETAAGASSAAAAAPAEATPEAAEAAPAVPQAFTWGKQLPGGPAPGAQGAAATPAAPTVPQAFTWGKQLPTVQPATTK
ncbi:cytochrome c [Devosia sp. ZB163]|uniref:c-type cytochrome n=1 Tax=Devosia sp. ZB163 TaxID=3025938 RepID=UPI00235ECBA8|nr:cytochrome c [Devosia sp. ZB163]MDC9823335.1 cytochrome c [Devosia sp. ZB163]